MAKVTQPVEISSHTVDKVTKTKLTLETYYTNLISQHEERETRLVNPSHLIVVVILLYIVLVIW